MQQAIREVDEAHHHPTQPAMDNECCVENHKLTSPPPLSLCDTHTHTNTHTLTFGPGCKARSLLLCHHRVHGYIRFIARVLLAADTAALTTTTTADVTSPALRSVLLQYGGHIRGWAGQRIRACAGTYNCPQGCCCIQHLYYYQHTLFDSQRWSTFIVTLFDSHQGMHSHSASHTTHSHADSAVAPLLLHY